MLTGLALGALLAQANAAHVPAATAEVTTTIGSAPLEEPTLTLARPRARALLGGFASALALSLNRWSPDPRGDGPSITLPSWVPGKYTSGGWRMPGFGHGLYLGPTKSLY